MRGAPSAGTSRSRVAPSRSAIVVLIDSVRERLDGRRASISTAGTRRQRDERETAAAAAVVVGALWGLINRLHVADKVASRVFTLRGGYMC